MVSLIRVESRYICKKFTINRVHHQHIEVLHVNCIASKGSQKDFEQYCSTCKHQNEHVVLLDTESLAHGLPTLALICRPAADSYDARLHVLVVIT